MRTIATARARETANFVNFPVNSQFAELRVWRDLNQNGAADAGELQTLAEAGIRSISLARTDVPGTNAGHDIGFAGSFTRADGTQGTAETIYSRPTGATRSTTPRASRRPRASTSCRLAGSGTIEDKSALTTDFDVLWLRDLTFSDVNLARDGADLLVTVPATGHVIRVDDQYASTTEFWGIEQLRFADGTSLNQTELTWF